MRFALLLCLLPSLALGQVAPPGGVPKTTAARIYLSTSPAAGFTVANPLAAPDWCISASFAAANWGAAYNPMWMFGNGNVANSAALYSDAASVYFLVRDGSNGVRQLAVSHSGWQNETAHSIQCCVSGGTLSLVVDGASVGTLSGAGTGIFSGYSQALNIGKDAGTEFSWGTITGFLVCPGGVTAYRGCR